jgi:hypothetical protein
MKKQQKIETATHSTKIVTPPQSLEAAAQAAHAANTANHLRTVFDKELQEANDAGLTASRAVVIIRLYPKNLRALGWHWRDWREIPEVQRAHDALTWLFKKAVIVAEREACERRLDVAPITIGARALVNAYAETALAYPDAWPESMTTSDWTNMPPHLRDDLRGFDAALIRLVNHRPEAAPTADPAAEGKVKEVEWGKGLIYDNIRYRFAGVKRWDIVKLLIETKDPGGWVALPRKSRSLGTFDKGDALRFRKDAIEAAARGSGNREGRFRIRP